ncbi:hypothetical protein BCR43DRAFT_490320 [Syncephalastrum racemosum]|uniref:Uncharacterized protein n=1 Tax=Syncephalastrum racemosum TaxID=13706 RepID=A0A1X2HFR3_SYNRA|nr:hypothetical protein BCR43DRAFT_490320 [Syncephalastrum racemosum]
MRMCTCMCAGCVCVYVCKCVCRVFVRMLLIIVVASLLCLYVPLVKLVVMGMAVSVDLFDLNS